MGSGWFEHVAVAAEAHTGLSPASLAPTPPNPAPTSPACFHFFLPLPGSLALPRERWLPGAPSSRKPSLHTLSGEPASGPQAGPPSPLSSVSFSPPRL